MNKPFFDALVQMGQARTAFDDRMLSALEASMKGEARATVRTPIPVSVPDERDGGLILLKAGKGAVAITEQISWARWKMVGFSLSGVIPETVQIESIRCLGGMNLLWHEEWMPLRAYQETPTPLRGEPPIISAPNHVEFSLRNVGSEPVRFGLWALGEPVESAL